MSKAHAKLSPSAADRWIHCPGSIRLAEQCPPAGSTEYADEGTAAHALAELKVLSITNKVAVDHFDRARASEYYCGEMEEATAYYAGAVLEIYEKARKADRSAELMAEQHFSLEDWIPGGFGTSDAVVIGNGTIEVIDLKYGKGVKVEAEGNPQLRLYGLGAAMLFGDIYDLHTVRMTIIQPRLDHISTEEMPLQELFTWAETVVKPAAKLALGKNAPTECGDWCRWCPAKAVCRTRAEKQLELAQYDFAAPDLLQPGEIGDILRKAEELTKWAADIQAYAFEQALAGEHYAGWKLVEGRSTRKWADDVKVAEALQAAGFPEAALYERKLYGITAMEKIVGKKKLTEVLGDLIVKPAGKPVLVPESDKRPALNNAADDFAEELPFC
ncbi:MAG: DUF2800 domain-containing protein [Mogibacterium sp.]|nr:DUF2800 domain-containing protein [Mogibacterium sp.]